MGDVSDQSKRRRVVYDHYCGAFYRESLEESLRRACEFQRRFFENNNRSETVRLRVLHRQIEATRHLYLMKAQRESKDHEKQFRINSAHLRVLQNLAADRQRAKHSSNLGNYGPATTRINLLSRIEREITRNTKSARRRLETTELLANMPVIIECDRSLPTLELLKPGSHIRHPNTPARPLNTGPAIPKRRGRISMQSATTTTGLAMRSRPQREKTSVRAQSCHGALLP